MLQLKVGLILTSAASWLNFAPLLASASTEGYIAMDLEAVLFVLIQNYLY